MMYETAYHTKDLSQFSFLITGGAGFIGSHIAEYLMKWNAKLVRVIDNLETGNYVNIKAFEHDPRFEFIEGDIRDINTLKKACDGIDFISHQAALGSVPRSIKDPARTNSVNVDGYLNVLIAANECKIKRVVYASSSSVYGDSKLLPKKEEHFGNPLSPYAVSKYTNELYAGVFHKTYGLEILGLRYFNIFGPRQDPNGPYAAVIPIFINNLLNGEEIFIDGDGGQTRDFTFVENAVQANIKAIFCDNKEALGQIFNIAVGEQYSVLQMFEMIRDYLKKNVNPNYRESRKGDVHDSLADISKAKNILSYFPAFKFKDGLAQTIEYFRSR